MTKVRIAMNKKKLNSKKNTVSQNKNIIEKVISNLDKLNNNIYKLEKLINNHICQCCHIDSLEYLSDALDINKSKLLITEELLSKYN